jgi:hypothetical protein
MPYYHAELKGRRLKQVEEHLHDCPECQLALQELRELSSLLHESPAAQNLTPSDVFVAQVGMRLPRKPTSPGWQKGMQTSWRLAPFGLLGAWVFMQTVFIVTGLLMWALDLIPGAEQIAGLLPQGSSQASFFSQAMQFEGANALQIGQMGLQMFRGGGPLGWAALLNVGLMLLIGTLYASWLASWWIQKSNGNNGS